MVKGHDKTQKSPEQEYTKEAKKAKISRRGKHPMPAILRVPCAMLFLMIVTIFFTWFLIWRTNMCDADTAVKFIQEKPDLAIYNYLVLLGLTAVLAAVTWRPFLSSGIIFAALSILSFISMEKYKLRNEPLLPEEFMMVDTAGDLTQFVDGDSIARLVWGVIFILAGSIIAEFYIRKFISRNTKRLPWWDKASLIPRATFTMIALTTLAGIAKPILDRKDTEWIEGLNLIGWYQPENYENNGFLIGFLYNLGNAAQPQPSGYSEARIAEIEKKYSKMAEADTSRKKMDEVVDNVVIILAETFYDPELLDKYYAHYGGDVVPNLHRIFQNYPSGYMYSPEYGGGTANVEFEVQTGLSNFWAQTMPYVNVVPKLDVLESAASWGKEFGFDTTAIHSYGDIMYKRNIVYPKIGYDEFIFDEKMKNHEVEYESGVLNDRSVYREILDIIEESDEPKLIGAVTMQNHSPYDQAHYPRLEFPLVDSLAADRWAIEPSFQSLHESDKYLGEFLEALDELDERTVVLWYGDHAMGTLGSYTGSEEKSERDIARFTPYFVYANFDIDSPYTTREVAEINEAQGFEFDTSGVDLPTMSPNCLQNAMYNILNVEKPALFYLVDEVCEQNPVLARAFYGSTQPKESSVLKEYELVNYDIMSGKQYWYKN